MDGATLTVRQMREFYAAAPAETVARVRSFSREELTAVLERLRVPGVEVHEAAGAWDSFRRDEDWTTLLAAVLHSIEVERGEVGAPVVIWSDLDAAGTSGRYFFLYLFAVAYEGLLNFLELATTPLDVIERTGSVLARHCATHQRKWGTPGVDAGWWMVLILRAELLEIGSLQFHRMRLGTRYPSPWYSDVEASSLGVGFRPGDPSIGLHIPQRADITPATLDATFEEARVVLARLWPVTQRRLATCQTWMLDDRLATYLKATSNIIRFQQRFTLLPGWREDDVDVLDFVFLRPNTALEDLPQRTSLERAIVAELGKGHWRVRTGWFDFDGI